MTKITFYQNNETTLTRLAGFLAVSEVEKHPSFFRSRSHSSFEDAEEGFKAAKDYLSS